MHRFLALAALLLATSAPPRAQQQAGVDLVRSYFSICDRDDNGWVSYREARDSLELDRVGYAALDTDRDGRVDFDEFRTHYVAVAERVGALPPPRTERNGERALPRQPAQILAAYDADGSEGLDSGELERLLGDYGRAQLSATSTLEKLDQNGDGRLRGAELQLLARLLSTLYVAGRDATPVPAPPRSIEELFGAVLPRARGLDTPQQPPLIVGPVPHFRRLDLDGDGGIELRDLDELMRPRTAPVSLAAVFATLDTDEDGRIDEAELALALGMHGR